jgi:histidinol-phosphatase (PHP family)
MSAACERAVELGVPGVAFTEHLDFTSWEVGDPIASGDVVPNNSPGIRPLDVTGYLAGIEECRDRFGSLRIWSGLEVGEPHLYAASASAVTRRGTFDRVLGSLHTLPQHGRLEYAGNLFAARPADEVMRTYFAELVRLIEGSSLFEVLAHLDFPRRYWPRRAGEYAESDYEEEYRAVLRALAGSGRVLEINTASPLASVNLLDWWREEGGRAVSIGSDAHLPWHVAGRFEDAIKIAEAAGFRAGSDPLDFWRH